jgi:hypothetical protein
MSHALINEESPAGAAFLAFCAGDLDVNALSTSARDEFASCARSWLSIPMIAEPTSPEDSPLPNFLRDFISELESAQTCTSVADDFMAAAELLTEVEAPSEYEVEALASAQDDLRSEADYLANVDPSEIGSPAVVGRYLSASRASRRHAVIRYMTTARMGNPSPKLRRVLDVIGGEGF